MSDLVRDPGLSAVAGTLPIEWIHRMATVAADGVAVEFAGAPVTYGRLANAIDAYQLVFDSQGMDSSAALHAALIHCLPSLAGIVDPVVVAQRIRELVGGMVQDPAA